MGKTKRPARPRTLERAERRGAEKRARDKERLFLLEDGGTPERPIEITSPALVEPKASAKRCPKCGNALGVVAHHAPTVQGQRLRQAEMECPRCGARRSVWFRLSEPN
jgi:ribosomal protein S27AE